jgi:hypothetical protein
VLEPVGGLLEAGSGLRHERGELCGQWVGGGLVQRGASGENWSVEGIGRSRQARRGAR